MMTVFSIGYPKGSPAGAAYTNQFIEEMKKSGFIQQAIERANLKGAVVPKSDICLYADFAIVFSRLAAQPLGGDGRSERRSPAAMKSNVAPNIAIVARPAP